MAFAELRNDRIIVETEWNERELIKRVPTARWNATEKHWALTLSWTACVMLRGVFGDRLHIGDKLTEWAWIERSKVDTLLNLRNLIEPTWEPLEPRLYPFQEVGRRFITIAKEAILGDEMGTGKTIQVLAALDATQEYPALVICPNSVKSNWEREIHEWCDRGVRPYVVTGGAVGRRRILDEAREDPHSVVIVNYEAMRLLGRLAPYGSIRLKRCRQCDPQGEVTLRPTQCEVHPKELDSFHFRTVIIDEAHRIKDPRSKQTRAVWAAAHRDSVSYRWALTGTPLANHPGDLWSLLHAVAPKSFPTKTHFVDRYCLQSWNAFGGLDIVGINPATRDEFFSILDPRFRRMQKAVVLTQLPPKVRSVRYVEMSPSQARHYRELEEGLGTVTPGGPLFARNDLTARVRLMQFASATANVNTHDSENIDDWDVELTEPSSKLDELDVVLEELGDKQVVICAQHRKLIELAAARLTKQRKSFGLITGKILEYERQLNLKNFQSGGLQYLLFTIQAGGVGLTMTASDTIIFLQRGDSMIDNKQAEDRVHRIGSERHESVYVIDIVTRDTVEERQIENLHEKLMRLDEITRDRAVLAKRGVDTTSLDEEEEQIMGFKL